MQDGVSREADAGTGDRLIGCGQPRVGFGRVGFLGHPLNPPLLFPSVIICATR